MTVAVSKTGKPVRFRLLITFRLNQASQTPAESHTVLNGLSQFNLPFGIRSDKAEKHAVSAVGTTSTSSQLDSVQRKGRRGSRPYQPLFSDQACFCPR